MHVTSLQTFTDLNSLTTRSVLLFNTAMTQHANFIHAAADYVRQNKIGPKDRYGNNRSGIGVSIL